MATIFITTELIAKGEYEFLQTFSVGEINVEERVYTETHEDRMYAAMTNLGYACKWLSELNISRGCICITTDQDGKDHRYKSEHDDLFKAIHSQHDYQKNRKSYEIFYGKYVKYLDRIRQLANEQEIVFTRHTEPSKPVTKDTVAEAEIFQDNSPFLTKNQKWNRDNILKLSLAGSQNKLMCRACQQFILYAQSDSFIPVKVASFARRGGEKLLRTNTQLVNWFLELHLLKHGKA